MEPVLEFFTVFVWQLIVIAILVALYRGGFVKKLEEIEVSPSALRLKVAEMQVKQDRLQDEVDALRFLVSGFVTEWEYMHLMKLVGDQPFEYEWGGDRNDRFIQEMIRLWDFGLVTRKNVKSWYDVPRAGDMRNYSSITDRGREYLRLRSQMQSRPSGGQKRE